MCLEEAKSLESISQGESPLPGRNARDPSKIVQRSDQSPKRRADTGNLPRRDSVSQMLQILGIDLSGPRNIADTCGAIFRQDGAAIRFVDSIPAAADLSVLSAVSRLAAQGPLIVGIDAPLSYNPGGGDRPSDAALRQLVRQRGGRIGIMPPTMIRMVYLTLRGISLARTIQMSEPQRGIRIVEVHPGAAMLLRGATSADLASVKKVTRARLRLLDWLGNQGLNGIPQRDGATDHFVMACAACLAAWSWDKGTPAWCFPASPPLHPYDFAC